MNDSASKIIVIYKILKINAIKYSELVYPVHHKGGAPVVHPNGTDDRQEKGEAGREQAQYLVTEAHGLSCGQGRIPDLQDSLAGRQRLL